MKGLIEPAEGQQLARIAARIPADLAIVEIGSHRGLSSCWLISGSRDGHGAHVTCIDPWPLYGADVVDTDQAWAEEGALERWSRNVGSIDGWPLVTPLRSTAIAVAGTWAKPVGFLFHDADHAYQAVIDDYLAWLPYLAPGAWVAVHDFYGSSWRDGGWVRDGSEQTAVRDVLLTSGTWSDVSIVGNLWSGRRS
jgi:predicted O-methyltransferase YrrM